MRIKHELTCTGFDFQNETIAAESRPAKFGLHLTDFLSPNMVRFRNGNALLLPFTNIGEVVTVVIA